MARVHREARASAAIVLPESSAWHRPGAVLERARGHLQDLALGAALGDDMVKAPHLRRRQRVCAAPINGSHWCKLSRPGNTAGWSVLFGSIHVNHEDVWAPQPSYVHTSFENANFVYGELKLDNAQLNELAACKQFPREGATEGATNLRDWMQDPTGVCRKGSSGCVPANGWDDQFAVGWYNDVKKNLEYLRDKMNDGQGMPGWETLFSDWETMRPVWLAQQMDRVQPEVKGREAASPADDSKLLDIYLLAQARKQNKRVDDIETVAEQCAMFNGQPPEAQLKYLVLSAMKMNDWMWTQTDYFPAMPGGKNDYDTLISEYLCGDVTAFLQKVDTRYVATASERFYRETYPRDEWMAWYKLAQTHVLDKRNARMAEVIISSMSDPARRNFFVVGVGHLEGSATQTTVHDDLQRLDPTLTCDTAVKLEAAGQSSTLSGASGLRPFAGSLVVPAVLYLSLR